MSDDLKRRAAEASLDYVSEGMRVGLGSGTTAAQVIRLLGRRVSDGLRIAGVPTSAATERLARQVGIPLTTLDADVDLCIDGADEIGPGLGLIKGRGGALLREKIVATAAKRVVIVADASKLVDELGAAPLPIEVVSFGFAATLRAIERAAAGAGLAVQLTQRLRGAEPHVTDSGHWIVDASFGRIPDPEALAQRLANIPGIVEHGLFLGLADRAIVASPDGVRELEASPHRARFV
jgi:ribose 5-phosphate isomerase A